MENLALIEGWPLVGGISDTIIHSLFSEIVASLERWPHWRGGLRASSQGGHI